MSTGLLDVSGKEGECSRWAEARPRDHSTHAPGIPARFRDGEGFNTQRDPAVCHQNSQGDERPPLLGQSGLKGFNSEGRMSARRSEAGNEEKVVEGTETGSALGGGWENWVQTCPLLWSGFFSACAHIYFSIKI